MNGVTNVRTYLDAGRGVVEAVSLVIEAIFMHNPIGPNALRGSASVVNQRLLHSDGSILG